MWLWKYKKYVIFYKKKGYIDYHSFPDLELSGYLKDSKGRNRVCRTFQVKIVIQHSPVCHFGVSVE